MHTLIHSRTSRAQSEESEAWRGSEGSVGLEPRSLLPLHPELLACNREVMPPLSRLLLM